MNRVPHNLKPAKGKQNLPKTLCFIPCKIVNSLLITFSRAAECTPDRNPVGLRQLSNASLIFDTAMKSGVKLYTSAISISWGACGGSPNRNDSFRPDGHATWQPEDEFAPAFFEGKLRCKTPKTILKPKGR
jgi:hypothetical protein